MTSRRPSGTAARSDDAAEREAKGSVHEAIGKLLGDDAAKARGTAEKRAAAPDPKDPPQR